MERAAIGNGTEQNLHMPLENMKITNPVLDELRADQLPAVMPEGAVGSEDAVAQEVLPLVVEGLAFAVVVELRRQDGLDVLMIYSEDDIAAKQACFKGVGANFLEALPPKIKVLVLHGCPDTGP